MIEGRGRGVGREEGGEGGGREWERREGRRKGKGNLIKRRRKKRLSEMEGG